jgi:oxygen-dependent protoporphyrinogen oxidase
LGFRREDVANDLNGYGYVIPRVEGSDLLACTWTSSKWEERAPAGSVLLRLYARRITSAEALEALAQDELRLTMGITARPILARVFFWQEAMPQYTLGHSRRLAVIDERCAHLGGLYLAGASYRGVGIPDCIESGFRAAVSAMEYLQ